MKQIQLPVPQDAMIAKGWKRDAWSYYDKQTYAAAGQTGLSFFQSGRTGSRTFEDTNWPGSGNALPEGFQFTVQFLMFRFIPGATVLVGQVGAAASNPGLYTRDILAIGQRGFVKMTYLSSDFVQDGPLDRFPTDTRLSGWAAAADATTAAAGLQTLVNYANWAGAPYRIFDLCLKPQVAFETSVAWPGGVVATPSTVAGSLMCIMKGVQDRRPQ